MAEPSVIKAFYERVQTLQSFLEEQFKSIPEAANLFAVTEQDPPDYEPLLTQCLVAYRQDRSTRTLSFPTWSMRKVHSTLHDTLYHVIASLLRTSSFSGPTQLLTLGFRQMRSNKSRANNPFGVENYFPNSLVNELKRPGWEALFNRLGDEGLAHLWMYYSLFMGRGRECWVQVTGIAMSELTTLPVQVPTSNLETRKRPLSSDGHDPNPPKRITTTAPPQITIKSQSPSNRIFERTRILYARPQRTARHALDFALPPSHLLMQSQLTTNTLMRRVFPSFFELPLTFTPCTLPLGVQEKKLGWRLDRIAQLLMAMQHRLKRISLRGLVQCHCPLPNTSLQQPLTAHSNYHLVARCLWSVVRHIVPIEMFGSLHNQKQLARTIEAFITSKRNEQWSLHQVLQGLEISSCLWLFSQRNPIKQGKRKISLIEMNLAKKLFDDWIYWLFCDLVIPLIRALFYVTETSMNRNRLVYFRHDLWCMICQPKLHEMKHGLLQHLPKQHAESILSTRPLSYSFVRLLPKENGLRPITNLRRKYVLNGRRSVSINSLLQNVFQVLCFETRQNPKKLGVSVSGQSDIYERLRLFQQRLGIRPNDLSTHRRLFMVKVDVKACYDSIVHDKLMEIILLALEQDEYMLQRYTLVLQSMGRIKKHYLRCAKDPGAYRPFSDWVHEEQLHLKQAVLIDQVVYNYEEKQALFKLLEEHLRRNLIKIGQEFYKQTIGIPQGSILSGLLCSLFYGDMDRLFSPLLLEGNTMLMRYVDDFICISTEQQHTDWFLETMHGGQPEYGCTVNDTKTVMNYHSERFPVKVVENSPFPWCGILIDSRDLSVSNDYEKYIGSAISDSVCLDFSRHRGQRFSLRLKCFLKPKFHVSFFDTQLNAPRTALLNVYQMLVVCAMKGHVYLRSLPVSVVHYAAVVDTIEYSFALIRARTRNSMKRHGHGECCIKKHHVLYLGYSAFSQVWTRKQTQYKSLLEEFSRRANSLRKQYQDCSQIPWSLLQDVIHTKENEALFQSKY